MDTKHKLLLAMSRRLELPSEALLRGDPCVELKGRGELNVTGHRGIIGYDEQSVRIATALGTLLLEGRGLRVGRMNREGIVVYGELDSLRWEEDV